MVSFLPKGVMMSIRLRFVPTVIVSIIWVVSSSFASIQNGNFQTGSLDYWQIQEDYSEKSASELVKCAEIEISEFAGSLVTGYNQYDIYVVSLVQEDLVIPENALTMVFDYQLIDLGVDMTSGQSPFDDQLSVSLLSSHGDIDPILSVDKQGSTLAPEILGITVLENGFFRVQTDISTLAGSTDTSIIFDLYDEDDGHLTQAYIDNIAFIVPEPASIVSLLIGGLVLAGRKFR